MASKWWVVIETAPLTRVAGPYDSQFEATVGRMLYQVEAAENYHLLPQLGLRQEDD